MQEVLREILAWSAERPMWQRDALRRLFVAPSITPADIEELGQLAKSEHGLVAPHAAIPFDDSHLGLHHDDALPISLVSLTHHQGANALAAEQTLSFGSHLTIVYGPNAAGKSGYTRILKQACRSRYREDILGNVLAGTAPLKLSATIKFKSGATEMPTPWSPGNPQPQLSKVSVFDASSAPVY